MECINFKEGEIVFAVAIDSDVDFPYMPKSKLQPPKAIVIESYVIRQEENEIVLEGNEYGVFGVDENRVFRRREDAYKIASVYESAIGMGEINRVYSRVRKPIRKE